MKITLVFDPAHLWEIYNQSYSKLLEGAKKQFQKRIGFALFAILVFVFLLTIQNPFRLFFFGVTVILCTAYFFFKRSRLIKACEAQIEESKNDVSEWINDLSQYNSFALLVEEDQLVLVLDHETFPYNYKDNYLLHMDSDFLYIQHPENTEHSLMIPRKSMSDDQFLYLSEFLEKKFDK